MKDNPIRSLSIHFELDGGVPAFVVVDSTVENTSSGGLRIQEDITLEEVRTLAREMTLKYSFIGLPRGGAKSGIAIPSSASPDGKKSLLREMGNRLAPLIRKGIYYPGMDMNCGPEDLKELYRGAGITLSKVTDTSYFTALSVAGAVEACRDFLGESKRPLTLAIEGFGSVGSWLARRLPHESFRIAAVSTVRGAVTGEGGLPLPELLSLRKEYGDECVLRMPGKKIPREEILAAEVDLLLPSARTWALHRGNAGSVRARCIVPIANAPYTGEALQMLQERGIVCLPGFVANSGGVFASSLYDSGVPSGEIERISGTLFSGAVSRLLMKSREAGQSPVRIAERIALARLEAAGGAGSEQRKRRGAFRKRVLPRAWYARQYAVEFSGNLRLLQRQIEGYSPCAAGGAFLHER
ncbi:MAG: Glu/Leu/Phe/Val dehydrogenase dimerization domain-containing protein [Thermodesulfovibrionales bacterium]